jgi:predicted double-glycine peptidase
MTYESLIEAIKFHENNTFNWIGESLGEYKHEVYNIIKEKNIKTILDYGCGKATFHKILFNSKKTPKSPQNINITGYDPCVPSFQKRPEGKYDLVLCIDVMEHVQENKVDEVLKDIFSFSNNVFLTITCYPATQILLNGKNAHYTVKDPEWWKEKLKPYDGLHKTIFQTKPNRSKITVNKEEWKPSAITLKKLEKNDKTLDETQKEKAKLLL